MQPTFNANSVNKLVGHKLIMKSLHYFGPLVLCDRLMGFHINNCHN